ncbi:putative Xanthine/uracil/thiamine/ascorbate permease family protein [Streptomyces misionensis JCM 4497]
MPGARPRHPGAGRPLVPGPPPHVQRRAVPRVYVHIPNPALPSGVVGAPVNLGRRHHDPPISGAQDHRRGRRRRQPRPGRPVLARPVLPHIPQRIHGRARGARRHHHLHGDGLHPPAQPPDPVRQGRARGHARPEGPDHRDRLRRGAHHPADGLRRQGAARARRRPVGLRRAVRAGGPEHDLAAGDGHVRAVRRRHHAAGRHRPARDDHERDPARAQTRHHHGHRPVHRPDRLLQVRLRAPGQGHPARPRTRGPAHRLAGAALRRHPAADLHAPGPGRPRRHPHRHRLRHRRRRRPQRPRRRRPPPVGGWRARTARRRGLHAGLLALRPRGLRRLGPGRRNDHRGDRLHPGPGRLLRRDGHHHRGRHRGRARRRPGPDARPVQGAVHRRCGRRDRRSDRRLRTDRLRRVGDRCRRGRAHRPGLRGHRPVLRRLSVLHPGHRDRPAGGRLRRPGGHRRDDADERPARGLGRPRHRHPGLPDRRPDAVHVHHHHRCCRGRRRLDGHQGGPGPVPRGRPLHVGPDGRLPGLLRPPPRRGLARRPLVNPPFPQAR